MKKGLILLIATVFVFSGTAQAKKKSFESLDINKDGKLSKEECQPSKSLSKNFVKKDKDKDGFLTKEETQKKKK